MQDHFVKNGIYMGIASILVSSVLYWVNPQGLITTSAWIGFVFTIYFMVKAIKDTKKDNNGYLPLISAFKTAWLCYILGTVISTVFMYILINYIDPSLLEIVRKTQIEALTLVGPSLNMTPAQVEEKIALIKETNPFGLMEVARSLPVSFLLPGAVFSIIIAAILRKNLPEGHTT
jgi:hypothetical protein